MVEALRQIRNTLRRRAGKLAFALVGLGLSFGFVAVVLAVTHAGWPRLPAGVGDGSYVTVSVARDTPAPMDRLALADVERFEALAPEVRWLYERHAWVEVVTPSGAQPSTAVAGVPDDYFATLGIEAALGSLTAPAPDAPAVVLGHETWRRDFGGRATVTDEFLQLADGSQVPIVGVAAPDFVGLGWRANLWILNPNRQLVPSIGGASPGDDQLQDALYRRLPSVFVFGRIDDVPGGVAALRALLEGYAFDTRPVTGSTASTEPGGTSPTFYHVGKSDSDRLDIVAGLETRPAKRREVVQKITWLGVVVALLIVLAFVSLIDMLLAENAARDAEQAVRIAIGATPADVFRQTLAENAVWVLAMAAIGWFSFGYVADLVLGVEPFASYMADLPLYSRLIGLATGAALLAAAFLASVGYVSWFVSRTSKAIAAAEQRPTRLLAATRRVFLFVAAASMLVVLSLAARYLGDARHSLRFAATQALVVETFSTQRSAPQVGLDAIASMPGVGAVTTASRLPLSARPLSPSDRGTISERPDLEDVQFVQITASPGFLPTLGVAMIAGHVPDADSQNEVVISRAAAVALAGEAEQALGMAITFESEIMKNIVQVDGRARGWLRPTATVVGVVDDVPYGDYDADDWPVIYKATPRYASSGFHRWLIVAAGSADDVVAAMRGSSTFAGATVTPKGTLAAVFQQQFLAKRSVELMLSGAAAFALLLALAGVGNSLARTIGEARGAIGVAFAIGATRTDLGLRYFGDAVRDLLLVAVVVAAVALAAKLAIPIIAAVVELWLLVPMLVVLAGVCAGLCLALLGQFARRTSISGLIQAS